MRTVPTILAVALLLAAPFAEARPAPALYFLKDGDTALIGDGLLNQTFPSDNATKARLVLVGSETLIPVQFATAAGVPHPPLLRGPLFVGLWTGEAAVLYGNLTATLYMVTGGERLALGNASVMLDANMSQAPDPLALVPPDPSDPQGAVLHVAAQVLPMVLRPPVLLNLGVVDMEFPSDSQLAIGFRLDQGSSPLPLPTGAFAQVRYDALLQPSFVFVPWYEPDPPRPAPSGGTGSTGGSGSSGSGGSGTGGSSTPTPAPTPTDDEPADKDSPGAGLVVVLALIGAALLARRARRS